MTTTMNRDISQLLNQNPVEDAMDGDAAEMGMAMFMSMPARGLVWISKGEITEQKLDEILADLNKEKNNE
ncbi:hypothetical protein [Paenibacillus prosopidis]|uniref:Uncharacterized protein n=1 Tax=Paenibacillus prosopidis TaxID=630520 RepID=A0A368W4Z5_9BACL|nr:hypothetical protein [Paenibacillus prosopidis]RCW50230.1 hypothetical protein DFP97_103248 [Paenibacillus prosopidis]